MIKLEIHFYGVEIVYLFSTITHETRSIVQSFSKISKTKRMIIGSIFSCLAAVFQMAGGLLPVVGYFISPLATAPILICSIFSKSFGLSSYLLTILLLLVLEPSELIIFPFTTGLLGLGIGFAFHYFEKRLSIILSGAISLTSGITILLFGMQFPVLGPSVSHDFDLLMIGSIFLCSIFYSWLWVGFAFKNIKKFHKSLWT
ncbi:hypothetical protein ACFSO7_13460 [Bacillus sp. CGMCC 1.16607]|uniref:hypothetical protein n=1 Tax=Bacillus sp. CGMCC 1.16607 TaxID=3351842 RepID=UPI0036296404